MMNNVVSISVVVLTLTLMMSQPLLIAARGAGGGGGHGHMSSHTHKFPHPEPAREHPTHPIEVQINIPPIDITQTCGTTNDTDFCTKTLTADPVNKDKDARQMSLLALDMAKNKGAEILASVNLRLQSDGNLTAPVKQALNVISDRYTDALGHIDQAVPAMAAPTIPFDDVKHWISGGMSTAEICTVAIQESNPEDVDLKNEDEDNTLFYKLCDNALSIVTSLQFVTWASKIQ